MCCKAPLLADFFFPLPKNPWFMLETVPIRNGLLRCQLRKNPTLSSLKLIVISSYLKWGNALLIREQLGLVTASTRLRNQCWGSLLLRYAGSLLHGSCCMGWRIWGFGKGPTQLRVQVSDCCRADQKLVSSRGHRYGERRTFGGRKAEAVWDKPLVFAAHELH